MLVGSKVFVGKAWRLAGWKCGAAVVYEFAIEGLRLAKSALGMCVQATHTSVTRCGVTPEQAVFQKTSEVVCGGLFPCSPAWRRMDQVGDRHTFGQRQELRCDSVMLQRNFELPC